MKKELTIVLISIFISFIVALAGSYNGLSVNGLPIIFHCLLITYGIQFAVFIPSYMFTTEKFFDLTGMITYLSLMAYIVNVRGVEELNNTGLILILFISVWALRLGLSLIHI